jgi:hypothetical protein
MPTYTQIGSAVSVGVLGAADITFSSIPSTYTDLVLSLSLRTAVVGLDDDLGMQFNGDTTSGRYSYRTLSGSGSAASSGGNASAAFNYAGRANGSTSTASTFNNVQIYIPNYAAAVQKSSSLDGVRENNATNGYDDLFANLYNQTTAISSIKIYSLSSSNFVQYSTAYLYGVSNA